MNRTPWSTDAKEILELINALIDGRVPVTLRRTGAASLRTRITAIHYHRRTPYLLLARPQGLADGRAVRDLLCQVEGLPILGFSCPITREGERVLATMLPRSVFAVDLRAHPRFTPRDGSMATFFVRGRSRVSICMMADISMGGVKLVGTPTSPIQANDIIGPCTLSLAGRDALISHELTVNRASVVRLEQGDGGQLGLGVRFELSEHEEKQLKEQLDFLTG